MAVSDRDFALVVEELKCLRNKMNSFIGSTGGYADQIISPGSSVFPNSFYDCDCSAIEVEQPDPNAENCSITEADDFIALGDLASQANFGGLFVFDAVNGVFYLPPSESNYENRNIGLSDVALQHGCKDVWWYQKKTINEDNIIIWQVGDARILRSENAGTASWANKTPDAPTGYSLSDVRFYQIVSDPFRQNTFYVLAGIKVQKKTFLLKTTDDGNNWSWTELTNYNGVTLRNPIWMCIEGNGGNLLWITTWGDDKIRALKINNDPTLTVSAEYDMGDATEWQVDNYFQILSPISQVDTNTVWFYGWASNPQGLGVTQVFHTVDEGLNWVADEQGLVNYVGSFKVSLTDDSGNRKYYMIENAP